ncbi:MAG: protein phosphatase 2C domain-containing protein [Prevotella sp.]|nr:protein phosphatase 2C domain-containing protein [Prevotellaceae bacterium]MDY4555293.1 protein phosphatase 2C domain-containing protein [Prevotella sp.]MDY5210094.1 protein phosphatase 2C domain-containing protein [Prevotella sp.]
MEVFEYTNKGCREENQDYIVHGSLPNGASIYIIADGMGGYSNGAVASKTVGDAIFDFVELNITQYEPAKLLKEAISFANDSLMLKRLALGAKKMGCVIAVLLIIDGYAYLSWLGDSRIYMFRNSKQLYRTEDHSVFNEMSKIKTLHPSNYEKYSSIVTKSIMGSEVVDVAPIKRIKVESGDVFILCSDGFYKEIEICKVLDFDSALPEYLDGLASHVSDNYSFIKVAL